MTCFCGLLIYPRDDARESWSTLFEVGCKGLRCPNQPNTQDTFQEVMHPRSDLVCFCFSTTKPIKHTKLPEFQSIPSSAGTWRTNPKSTNPNFHPPTTPKPSSSTNITSETSQTYPPKSFSYFVLATPQRLRTSIFCHILF